MTFITVYAATMAFLILFGGGGCYDPDPSADFRHEMYQKQQRKEWFNKLFKSFK